MWDQKENYYLYVGKHYNYFRPYINTYPNLEETLKYVSEGIDAEDFSLEDVTLIKGNYIPLIEKTKVEIDK